ncbi:MAG: PQQ-dependent dehydrogenase, methanol/ethanol family [Pseudomonadota bacterium]
MCVLSGCGSPSSSDHSASQRLSFTQRATSASSETNNWLLHGRTYNEQRHSPLTTITPNNVDRLGLAWYVDLPDHRGQEATPLIVDGVMYVSAAWSRVFAFDAVTGEEIWSFNPEVDKSYGARACCDVVNRGVAYWDGRIIVGTLDGRLISVDAKTGVEQWSVLTVDQDKPYTITGAPRVANGKVFIGNGGAEYGVRGYIGAYDVGTGDLLWRFYTVPGNPEDGFENKAMKMAAETWQGEWWKLGGGGTVWDSMAYDPELNLLYVGTGNGSPWNPKLRSEGVGDNLFLSSIVALNADTGEYVWHYQTTPGEGWDYTATQHMILADIEIDDETRQVIMQAPKNGFFYVLDRRTGEFISAQPFVPTTWASKVDETTGRPVINAAAKYWETGQVAPVAPGWSGGHSWHPMSFSPTTGLVYIPAQEMAFPYMGQSELNVKPIGVNLGVDTSIAVFPDDPAAIKMIKGTNKGYLTAWDPVAQKEVWRVEHPGPLNGGVLTTASNLVFQGNGSGALIAYGAADGKKLWDYDVQTGIVAPPVSYAVNDEQYVAVAAGWGGIIALMTGPIAWNAGEPINRSRVLVFKLGGDTSLPEPSEQVQTMTDFSSLELDEAQVTSGMKNYIEYCGACHGVGAVGGGVVPDLRYSAFLNSEPAWQQVVREGSLSARGMIGFDSVLSQQDAEDIRIFVVGRNQFAHKTGETTRLVPTASSL